MERKGRKRGGGWAREAGEKERGWAIEERGRETDRQTDRERERERQ